jgi:uncharacterized repeat protein (TIGR01451 family)
MKFFSARGRLLLGVALLAALVPGLWWTSSLRSPRAAAPAERVGALPLASSPAIAAPLAPAPDSPPPPPAPAPTHPARLLAVAESRRFSSAHAPVPDRWSQAETLAAAEGPELGEVRTRVRIVRSDFKHPLLRLEEAYRLDTSTGSETLLAQEAMVADHLIIKPAPGIPEPAFLPHVTTLGGAVRSYKPASGLYLITLPAPLDPAALPAAVDAWKRVSDIVAVAEPDFVVHALLTPNDPSFSQLHGLHNTGQSGGVPDADIDAPEAWDIATGSRSILVGVIDTGIDHTHPDLAANMWTNPGEIPGNGIDDDGNGYVDDVRGWDFVNDDNNPMDDHYHGTHCAGTIGAVGGNGVGIVGVAHQVSMVGLKFLSASGSGATSDAIEAVAYSTLIGCHLTSNSWGGGGYSQALHDAIAAAGDNGRLFIAAAGNNGRNTDSSPNYPSGYALDNIIAVAATDHADALASFSNYGAASVDLGAPGVNTYSTMPGAAYGNLSGTSMATPHVSGAAAVLLGRNPGLPALTLKSLLLATVDPKPALDGKTVSGGRLNLHSALTGTDQLLVAPSAGWTASGPVGGPFPAASTTFTLSNLDSVAHGWSASIDVPWASLSASSGTVPAGGGATFSVTLVAASAQQLPAGNHSGTVTLTDLATNRQHTRVLTLSVLPPPVFSFDLDTDPGWPRTGQWAYGQPTGQGGANYGYPDPNSGYTGTRVFGVNLQGDYSTAFGGPYTLTAGPFDLTGYAATRLQFRRWLNSDYAGWVSSRVEISTNGSTWTALWTNANSGLVTDSAWSLQDFEISAHADNRATVYIRWVHQVVSTTGVWPLSGWNIDDIAILGTPPRSVGFLPIGPVSENVGTVNATLRLQPAPSSPQQVQFTSSAPGLVPAPAALTVPAGAESLTVPLSVLNNTLLDGTRTVTVTPSTSGYASTPLSLVVQDDETATLTLQAPATGTEGGPAATATVLVSSAPAMSVSVTLASSSPDVATVPTTVLIPAGASSATFTITFPDNTRLEGTRHATLTASVAGWTAGQASIAVADNDPRTLAVSLASGLAEGRGTLAEGGTVTLAGTLTTPLTVTLASSDTTEIIVPATVTIPAGATSAKFDLTLPDDAEQDGVQTVTVTASADTFDSGTATTQVADNDPASFAFATVASPQYVGQAFAATISALDIDGAPASGFTGTADLSGRIGASPAPVAPAQTGAFVNGVWTGPVTCQTAGEDWTLRAALGTDAIGASNAFTVRVPVVQTIALANNDIVYDPGTDRIYASTPSGTLVPIDPNTGALGTPVTVSSTAATLLARATDGSRLWVTHDGAKQIIPVALPSLAPGTSFSVPYAIGDMLALPGFPNTLVTADSNRTLRVYDSGVPRNAAGTYSDAGSIEAGAAAGRVFGYNIYNTGFEFHRLQVNPGGITAVDSRRHLVSDFNVSIHSDGNLVAASSGRVVDGENFRILASLPYAGVVRPDLANKRVFLLSDHGGGLRRLRAYDTDRFSEVGVADVTGVAGTPSQLTRVGAGRLAFRTPTQVFLLNTPLVPTSGSANLQVTQLATPNPAVATQPLTFLVAVRNLGGGPASALTLTNALPAGASLVEAVASLGAVTTSAGQVTVVLDALGVDEELTLRVTVTPAAAGNLSNTASVTAATGDPDTNNNTSTVSVTVAAPAVLNLRRVSLGARDLAYDPLSDRLLVTTSNTAAAFPNSLLRLTPTGLAALSADFLGDNPGRLKLSSDGQYAYAILDGSFEISQLPLGATVGQPANFAVNQINSPYGFQRALDITPIPGRPAAVAARLKSVNSTGGHGVGLFENGMLLPMIMSGIYSSDVLVDSINPQHIYGYCNESSGFGFTRIQVGETGLARLAEQGGLINSYAMNRMKRAGSLVYTNNGRVIDPEAFALVADLGFSGPVEPSLDDDRVYILDGSTLRTFDLQTHAPAGTLALGTLDGTPTNLVRCGGRSLAFVTSTGVLYLLDVPALVPPPPLRVVLPARLTEGAGTVPGVGRVEIQRPAEADVAVTLTSSSPEILDVTRTLVIPAGATSAPFSVQVTDNGGLNGTRAVTVSASTPATYTPKPATVLVDDDEVGILGLILPATLIEGAGAVTGQATVTLSEPALAPTSVALASSDTTELQVPATVVIPAGASSVTFTLTLPDDDLLDGPQPATVTATVPGYTSGTATTQVEDNESRALTLTVPATVNENSSFTFTITLSGKLVAPLTVSFASGNTGRLSSPSAVTIAAGQSAATAYGYPVNNSLRDGAAPVTITASASGFTNGSATTTVRDDEPAGGSWSTIASPQTAGVAFSATLTLVSIDGLPVNHSGTATITATQGSGSADLVGAPISRGLSGGASTATHTIRSAGADTRLVAQLPGLEPIASAPFTVASAAPARFGVSALASPRPTGEPTGVTLTALDAFNNPVTSFTGSAALAMSGGQRAIGAGTAASSFPLYTFFHDCRMQAIYTAAEIGGAGELTALSFRVLTPPPQALNNWTIRLKHTSLAGYPSGGSWESTGWTVVHQSNATISAAGWVEFVFSTPFAYNGTSNLLVDFSFNNSSYTSNASVEATTLPAARALVYYTDSGYGDPLTWNGSSPSPQTTATLPNLRLRLRSSGGALSPATTGAFTAGVWTGPVTFTQPGTDVALHASSGTLAGLSNTFDIELAAPVLAPEPPVTGGTANTLAWTPPAVLAGTPVTLVQAASSPAFASPLESPWLGVEQHTFSPLAEGQTWHFRARSRLGVPFTQTWTQTSTTDFAAGSFSSTSGDLTPHAVTLAKVINTVTENFDAPGSAWSSSIFSDLVGTASRIPLGTGQGPNTTPPLPINQGGDQEAYFGGGTALRPATGNTFADGSIEAIIAPSQASPTLVNATLLLRGARVSPGYPDGYTATVLFYSDGTARASLGYNANGNGFSLYVPTNNFTASAQDNFRVRFETTGSQLSMRVWRLTATPTTGQIIETPVNLAVDGSPALTATHTLYSGPGAPGLSVFSSSSSQAALFEDVHISAPSPDFVTSGQYRSPLIAPTPFHRWGTLNYSHITPTGTSLTVDVLADDDEVLAGAVASGTDLSALPAVAARASIRLRATLATTDPAVTPSLNDWSVTSESAPPQIYDSPWSTAVSSIQDATAPALALTSPLVVSGPEYSLTGTASDANGVAALTVGGLPAATVNGYATWSRFLILQPGENILTLLAGDTAAPANQRTQTITVLYRLPDADHDGLPDAWETAHGLDGASADGRHGADGDFDGDGIPNLLEYAFGLDPRAPDSAPTTTSVEPDAATGERHLVFRYRRLLNRAGLVYTVLVSGDLRSWAPPAIASAEVSATPNDDGLTETVVVRIEPALGTTPLFVRLKVEAP